MNTFIALLRGINVGGHGKLPMVILKELVAGLGGKDVNTYIQSGNVVFRHAGADTGRLAADLAAAVAGAQGFRPQVLVLTREELEQAAAANPFPQAVGDPKTLHLYFLPAEPRQPRLPALKCLQHPTEEVALLGRVFYFYAPYGVGRSRLAGHVESALGLPCTARNWRTVQKLLEMARALP